MYELTAALLETETTLPIDAVGWVTLLASLLVTLAWLAYLYR